MYTACQTCNTTPGNDCFVSALDPGIPYTGPPNLGIAISTGKCECNTVVYSMLAACAVCQGGGIWDIVPFSDFSSSCVDTQIELYPFATPSGTAIPPWASLPLVNDTFDAVGVRVFLGNDMPVNRAISPKTTKDVAGKVAGGVIGGLALLSTIGGALYYAVKRRRRVPYIHGRAERYNILLFPGDFAPSFRSPHASTAKISGAAARTFADPRVSMLSSAETMASFGGSATDMREQPALPEPMFTSPRIERKAAPGVLPFPNPPLPPFPPGAVEGVPSSVRQAFDSGWRLGDRPAGGDRRTLPPPYTQD
ncbi:hypothetical protein BD309DRAFT_405423 [Dichomitus squalens]|uniref:Uncharacterized protein n=1 Tax=Dichomitus squalens TaxID=114155 RepID=A0A4V2K6I3_9APHY|nr:hypothetical protein BD309DRAFT_405423 [Dichomitus squalens]TBU52373.1 hypothetical protein BD310DRAFT_241915 [Dichomitus squalens]